MTTTSTAARTIKGLPPLPDVCAYWVEERTDSDTWGTHVIVGIEGPQGTLATGNAWGSLSDRRVVKAAKRAYRELQDCLVVAERRERYAHGIVPAVPLGKVREAE